MQRILSRATKRKQIIFENNNDLLTKKKVRTSIYIYAYTLFLEEEGHARFSDWRDEVLAATILFSSDFIKSY